MKKQNKKIQKLIAAFIAIASMTATSSALAVVMQSGQPAPVKEPTPTQTTILNNLAQLSSQLSSLPGMLSGQSGGLQAEIQNLATAAIDYVGHQNYQIDTNLAGDETTNTATTQIDNQTLLSPGAAATALASNKTQNNIDNNLTQFSWAMNPSDKDLLAANGKPFTNYMNENSIARLTLNTPASDTLYITNENLLLTAFSPSNLENLALVKKPETINNNFLNFSNIVAPTAYTPIQQKNANLFVKYATQGTQNLVSNIDFSALNKNPTALVALKNTPVYQNYVFNVRTILALQSIAINALNHLIAERTPMPGLGQAAGVTTSAASPLQVDAYIANHRVQNPVWYQGIQAASPATLQRKTLVILAEIEHQNYEAQLQREQLLAQLAALNIQLNLEKSKGLMAQEGEKVNQAIQTALNPNAKPSP